METLKCFECKIEKPLSKYAPNRRKYQIKSNKGMETNQVNLRLSP